ncbi:hypothetical protein Bbelb_004030 [Branchiostoma belcheri]|nr:hypothetical protein Bbelb_004030 [Branchiostoma belcheri]
MRGGYQCDGRMEADLRVLLKDSPSRKSWRRGQPGPADLTGGPVSHTLAIIIAQCAAAKCEHKPGLSHTRVPQTQHHPPAPANRQLSAAHFNLSPDNRLARN